MLPVVVLCGGFGTRLRSVVPAHPKVLAPIRGRPFLDYLLRHLRRQGFTDVILGTGYLGNMVGEYVGNGHSWGLRTRCVREPEPLGTGGALRFVRDEAELASAFLVVNGDTFLRAPLDQLVRTHENHAAAATMALVQVDDPGRYGTVVTDAAGKVVSFVEKNSTSDAPAWINAGVYVLDPAVLDGVAPGHPTSLETEVFPRLMDHGLYGHRFPDAVFLDIGTPGDFERSGSILAAAENFSALDKVP